MNKCPAPAFRSVCLHNLKGICCRECDKQDSCRAVCLNHPEKCGIRK